MNTYNLTDSAIGHIAQLVQMAILTGTDIMDHLRTAQFCVNDNSLDVHPDYHEVFNSNIKRMLEDASQNTDTDSDTGE